MLANIQQAASADEVSTVIHLPLHYLTSQSGRLRAALFRDLVPYWRTNVTDLLRSTPEVSSAVNLSNEDVTSQTSEKESDSYCPEGQIEVWGLTGWYLNLIMRVLGTDGPKTRLAPERSPSV